MKIVRHVSRAARYALFAALVGSALALSVLRFWLLPEASRFRGGLEARAGAMLGASVRIGAISARMRGLEPQLVLRQLSLQPDHAGGAGLSVRKLALGVSLLQSMLQGRAVLTSLRVEGAGLTLTRGDDGKLAVAGLDSGGAPPLWLFALERLRIEDADLSWLDPHALTPVPLGRFGLTWSSRQSRHRLSGLLQLAPDWGGRIALAASLNGSSADPGAWQGEVFLEGASLRLDGPVRNLLPEKVRAGPASGKLWGHWESGGLREARGLFDLEQLTLPGASWAPREQSPVIEMLSGRYAWERSGSGWLLSLGGLQWAKSGTAVSPMDFTFALDNDLAGGRRFRAAGIGLRIEDLRPFQNFVSDSKLHEALRSLAPTGQVEQPRLVLDLDSGQRWGFCAHIQDLRLQPWKSVPGLGPLKARVCGSDRRGHGSFSLDNAQFRAPQLWPQALAIQAMAGGWTWEQGADGLIFSVPELSLLAPGIQGRGLGSVRLAGPDFTPFVDLQAHLWHLDVKRIREYLPVAAMPESSSRWLREALAGGFVEAADVLVRGPLDHFPFRGGEGVFQARARLKDAELSFHPDWPSVQGLSGSLEFLRAGMDVYATSAQIGGVPILRAEAHAADFDRDPWMNISGSFETQVQEALRFLERTPLRQIPERVFKYADPKGPAGIDLKLKVYLPSDRDEVQVDGAATLKNARLEFPSLGLGIRELNGVLGFSEKGVRAQAIKGTVLGRPVTLDASDGEHAINLELKGEARVEDLATLAPAAGLPDFLKGTSAYRLQANIPHVLTPEGDPMRLSLDSDLAGMAVKVPAPLGKAVGVKRDMRVEMAFPNGEDTLLRAYYGLDSQMELWLDEHAGHYSVAGGEIHLGRVTEKISRGPGLRVRARLSELDGSAWRDFLTGIKIGVSAQGALKILTVQTDSLRWEGRRLGAFGLDLAQSGSDWQGRIDSDLARGDLWLKLPQFGYSSLKLDLRQLVLPEPAGESPSPGASPSAGLAADAMPVLLLHADRTLWRGADLGSLDLTTERWTQGLNIKDLSLSQRGHRLQLKGSWLGIGPGGETRLDGKLDIADLGEFLTGLGYPKEIEATPTQALFSLNWPGAPPDLRAAGLSGGIDLKLGRGSVLNMEPGLGRVLAVLNLDSLKRLLLLDFSDMFGKGLSYDSMRGRFDLGGGQARTSGFLIDAAAGTILVSGRAGLVARDLDQTVTVIPHTLASLPMSGVMVGGAAVGAALSMAGKLVGQDSVTLASNRYAIKGSWDNPQVSRIEGNMTLDVLNRAWSGIKNFSGFGNRGEEVGNE